MTYNINKITDELHYQLFIIFSLVFAHIKYRLLQGIFHIISFISPRSCMIYECGLRKGMIWNMPCYDLFIIYFNSGNTVFRKFMNIDRKVCNTFQKQLINLLYQPIWATCETGWNNNDSSYYSKQNSKFYHRVNFKLYYLQQASTLAFVRYQWKLTSDK